MCKLEVLEGVPVEQCRSETNAKSNTSKSIDIDENDGDLVEIRSRLIKSRWSFARRRLQCDFMDGYRVTLVELDNDWEYASQIIQTHVNGHKLSSLPFVLQRRSVCGSCLQNKREVRLVGIVAQQHVRNTKRDDECRSDRHGHTDEHGIRDEKN